MNSLLALQPYIINEETKIHSDDSTNLAQHYNEKFYRGPIQQHQHPIQYKDNEHQGKPLRES